MSDIELVKVLANSGGLGLALYIVYLIVKMMLAYNASRSLAQDELALKTIEVVSKSTEAFGQIGRGLEAVATAQKAMADSVMALSQFIKRPN